MTAKLQIARELCRASQTYYQCFWAKAHSRWW